MTQGMSALSPSRGQTRCDSLVLVDPRARDIPDVGLATFEDLESGESVVVDTGDPAVRKWYSRSDR